jgi:hypothetical protein
LKNVLKNAVIEWLVSTLNRAAWKSNEKHLTIH